MQSNSGTLSLVKSAQHAWAAGTRYQRVFVSLNRESPCAVSQPHQPFLCCVSMYPYLLVEIDKFQ